MKPVLIRQHVESAPPGLLAAWLDARDLRYEVDRSWLLGPLPDPTGYAFVVSLGHDRGAGDTHDPAVAAERELLALAVAREVPVLGLCYGGQVLAQRLADLTGLRVQRTARSDSTALGAATLAGLAAGVWDRPEALPEVPLDLVAEPQLAPSRRTLERERWAEARELTARWRPRAGG